MLKNINKPAPRWYRIFNRIFPLIENLVLASAAIYDINENAKWLLMWKLGSSFIRQILDAILVESQVNEQ